jgi:hypothetical protein
LIWWDRWRGDRLSTVDAKGGSTRLPTFRVEALCFNCLSLLGGIVTWTCNSERMSALSPSPAPRRSVRNRQAVNSPPRHVKVTGGSRTTSRFATPVQHNDNVSSLSNMDVDEASSIATERSFVRSSGETMFAKSEELAVSSYAHLPVELKQTLRSASTYLSNHI